MKQILIILMLTISSLAKCQNANIITSVEYENIEINNIKLIDIRNTLGIQKNIESLFGKANKIEKDDDPIYGGEIFSIAFNYNGLNLSFSEKELSSFYITNDYSNISIKGKLLTIGDNINKLGNVIFNTDNDNSKSIIFMKCEGCNSFIFIDFDQSTKAITKIGYIEQT